jgi:YD repeat-containing protein
LITDACCAPSGLSAHSLDETRRRFDAAGSLVLLIDSAGNGTKFRYDGLDRAIE